VWSKVVAAGSPPNPPLPKGGAPEAPLFKGGLGGSPGAGVSIFLSTGFEHTLSQVEAKVIDVLQNLSGMGGGNIKGIPCYVGLRIDGNLLPLIRVYGCPREDVKDMVIIGRDVLNQYCIQFDGPKEILTFIDP